MERTSQAIIGGALSGVVAATIANLKEGFGEPEEGGGGLVAWLISLAILAAVTAIVWLVVARIRGRGGEPNPTAGLVFAILALVGLVAFWAGISGAFAGATAAVTTGGAATTQQRRGVATVALGIAGVATVLMLIASIFG